MRKILIITLSTLVVLSLAGCGNDKKKEEKPVNNNQEENNKPEEPKKVVIKNPGCVIGKEEYPIKINGKNRTLKLEYYNYDKSEYVAVDSEDTDNDFYVTYKYYIDNVAIDGLKAVDGKIYVYDEESIEKLKDADGTKNFVEKDRKILLGEDSDYLIIKPSVLKGNDKEYLVISMELPTLWPQKDIIIASDTTGLLGELFVEGNMGVKLSGKDAKKYIADADSLVTDYHYMDDDKIVYLKPTPAMYKDGYVKASGTIIFDEYAITVKNGNLLNKKTNNQYKGTDVEGGDSEITMFYAK